MVPVMGHRAATSVKAPTLGPGDGYAVPLFGEAEPAAQSLFALPRIVKPQVNVSHSDTSCRQVTKCPACGGAPCAGCGATALTIPNS